MKHLIKIAQDQQALDIKKYSFMSGRNDEQLQRDLDSNVKHLKDVRNALLNGRLYFGVESVSKSGMSRTIVIKYVKDNELHGVDDSVYRLASCDSNRRISGYGMDMLFSAQYNIFQALCPAMRYQDKMPRYKNLF